MQAPDSCVFTILSFFLPQFRDFRFKSLEPSASFDFTPLCEANIESITWTQNEFGTIIKNFVFICAPISRWGSKPVADDSDMLLLAEERFYAFLPDTGGAFVRHENAGVRYLTSPGNEWRTGKLMLTIEEPTGGRPVYILLPWPALANLLALCGFGYIAETEPRFVTAESNDNDQLRRIESVENSIVFGRGDFFYSVPNLLIREDLADKEGAGKLSQMLSRMLQSGTVNLPHLATLVNLRPEYGIIREMLSVRNTALLDQYRASVNIGLVGDYERFRWRNQVFYQLRQAASRVWTDDPKVLIPLLPDNSHLRGLTALIRNIRFRRKESILPLGKMIGMIIDSRAVNPLITGDGKERLIAIAAFEGERFLAGLYGLFKPVFQDEMHNAIGEFKAKVHSIPREERERLRVSHYLALYEYLEREILKREDARKDVLDMKGMGELFAGMSSGDVCLLYNLFGYEKFVNFFDIFRYHPSSPLNENDARKLFYDTARKLPFTEFSIAEDIYNENINRSRLLSLGFIEKAYKRLREEFLVYRGIGFFGEAAK
ncbi:MAG: hypothetical protein HPY53_14480 [Brevinematales bacterium]|nr:hypothetical protein [Brevinematales bacterium]